MTRHRHGLVVAAWALAALAALPLAQRLEGRLRAGSAAPGSEAAAVERRLASEFDSPFARSALLVVRGLPPVSTRGGRAALERIVAALEALPAVAGTLSPASSLDTLLVGRSGAGALVLVGLRDGVATDSALPQLRSATARLRAGALSVFPAADLAWTGQAALDVDLRRTGAREARRAEARAVPAAALLGAWAFGGVAGALVAALVGGVVVLVSLGLLAVVSLLVPVTLLARNVVSLLGLALGIDYALWLHRRRLAARASGVRTIALAGATVAVGLAPLVAAPVGELRSVGVAALLAVAVAVACATTLLPGALARLPARGGASDAGSAAEARWAHWAERVTRRPWRALALSLPPLLLLAWPALRMRPAVEDAGWLPASMESARGLRALDSIGRGGVAERLRVLLSLPRGERLLDPAGWAALERVQAWLERDPRVGAVRSARSVSGGQRPEIVRQVVPARVLDAFLSRDRSVAALEVAPAATASAADVARLVRDVRRADAARVAGVAGARLQVGGLPAYNLDYAAAIAGRAPATALLVVTGTFLVLLAGFRSLAIAVKAVALNLLTVAAAFGAAVLVFQDGVGARLAGLAGPLDGLFPTVLLLAFCAVFGISMDYEVFLVGSIAEARRAGADDGAAIVRGVARSARVITGAAAIMVSIFVAFAAGDLVPMRILGFVLAVAVALDATVVRLVVAPAVLAIAGRWNWWPGRMASPEVATTTARRRRAPRRAPIHTPEPMER